MGTFGSSKVAKNTTNVSNDNRTQDNKVAAQDSNVVSTAGGALAYNDSKGSINAGANSTINLTSHDSVQLAGDIARGAQNAAAAADAGLQQLAQATIGTIASLAQGKEVPDLSNSPARWAVPLAIAAAVIVAGVVYVKVKR